ncbi:uncharacterized protein [Fopius arisanus]|uniref:Odorant receptor n=1 Tax=Fopius arisanus TaxID=64838 RepID=A0A9R1TG75_9HYME|nr:PREDICTED: uncharacterized protein LOC105270514 isoform X2 [Fopius arisanus]
MSLEYCEIEGNERIDEDFRRIGTLLIWQKYFLTIGGLWPMERTYIRCSIWTVYLALHLVMEYIELFTSYGNFNYAVISVLESTMQSMVFIKLIAFRYSKTLYRLLEAMREEFSGDMCDNREEKKLYLKFHQLSRWYYKLSVPYIMCGATLYVGRPMITSFFSGSFGDNSSTMVFPFQIKLPFAVLDMQTYMITYAYLIPMVYLLACQNAWICLLITIQLHICGQLSVVEYRLRNLADENHFSRNSHTIFKSSVDLHSRAIWMSKSFDNNFHLVLLVDLVVMTLMLGLISYIIVIADALEDSSTGPVFIFCGFATLALIYGYCIVGEALSVEKGSNDWFARLSRTTSYDSWKIFYLLIIWFY